MILLESNITIDPNFLGRPSGTLALDFPEFPSGAAGAGFPSPGSARASSIGMEDGRLF